MKKNLMIKIASLMLVLTLASTCMIGTTFAKYVTADQASDTARVAKWGITVSTSGTLFGTTYKNDILAYDDAGLTVQTSDTIDPKDKVVAPGTQNMNAFQVSISGDPEVAYDVFADNNSTAMEDIWLRGNNTYGVMTLAYGINEATDFSENDIYKSENGKTFTLVPSYETLTGTFKYYRLSNVIALADGDDYYPIVWTVTPGGSAGTLTNTHMNVLGTTGDNSGIAAEIAKKLNDLAGSANQEFNYSYTLGWSWAFGTAGAATDTDKKDTILGNLIAGSGTTNVVVLNGSTYYALDVTNNAATSTKDDDSTVYANLDITFALNVRIEQVD